MIRKKIRAIIVMLTVVSAGAFSCKDIVSGLNENPNYPTDAEATMILTGIQLGNIAFHEGHTARVAGFWSGYFTGTDRVSASLQAYVATGSSFSASWQDVYYAVFNQERLLEERALPLNNRMLIGIARTIKAHAAGTAAALWGDIPYSQTGNIEAYPNPVFDPQLEVYDSVQVLLDKAIADLESKVGTSPGAADIHFGGDASKWMAVAHTLKARFYLDVRNYELAYEEALKGINAPSASLLAPHGTSTGNLNFFSYNRSLTDMTSEAAYLPTLLDDTHANYRGNARTDERARFNYYFTYTTAQAARTRYLPNTLNTAARKGIFATNASYSLVTYQENLLILAETALRTRGLSEGLERLNHYRAYLNRGGYLDPTYIATGEFLYEPYEAGDLAPGGVLNKRQETPEQALLREILLEKYITSFGQKQGFTDLRRTRKESVAVPLPPNTGELLPERFVYALDETNTNSNAPSPIPGIFEVTPVNR